MSAQSGTAPVSDADAVMSVLKKHLEAVSNKDLESLASTLSPSGKMQLILPGMEPVHTAGAFMDFHQEWFQDDSWSFEAEVVSLTVGVELAGATVDVMYREPLRDGVPYYNHMTVTYMLAKVGGQWYIISDHASSVEKSTD